MTPQEELNEYIERHKLRKTFERQEILQLIEDIDGHFTVKELYEKYTGSGKHLSRASFYNTIECLHKASIIIKHPFYGAEQQYELKQRANTHHHRICTNCGSIKEFTDKKISQTALARQFNAFDTHYHSIYLYGLCSKCRPKKK